MALLLLLGCYCASLALLVLVLRLVSSPARWNRPSYYLAYFILVVVLVQTLLVCSAVLLLA